MIQTDFHFFSQTLDIRSSVTVLLPEVDVIEKHGGKAIPTLYLLHGLSDDHTGWLLNTRIAQYARKYYLAVVMPAVNRSFYTDMAHGAKYWTFISEELPRVMETCFPLSRLREERFVAGLSMGGYGAMKLGLLRPGRYAAAASLSGALMMQESFTANGDPSWIREMEDVFGSERALRSGDGNLALAADKLRPEDAPRLYVACGTNDFLYEANQAFVALYGQKFGIRYDTHEGEDHTWDYWDARIRDVLNWLELEHLENVW